MLSLIPISIHTPARGVTTSLNEKADYIKISIHTPARGVTPFFKYNFVSSFISIHTPARGVTLLSCDDEFEYADFNPHSRKGSDKFFLAILQTSWIFQSTLPQGE